MTTQDEIIQDAATEIGVLVAGSSLATSDHEWAVRKLNRFLRTLSSQGLSIPTHTHENFNTAAGIASYTIGSGQTFDTTRPDDIVDAFVRVGDDDYPVDVQPMWKYWEIQDKTDEDRPYRLFYDKYTTSSSGTIYPFPVPDAVYDLHIVSLKPFTTYSDIVPEDLVLLPEYEEMLVANMAVKLARRYGRPVPKDLTKEARKTLQDIKGSNLIKRMRPARLNIVGRRGRAYDIDRG